MAIVEVTIVPLGTGSTSLSQYVADCHRVLINQKHVSYELTSMGTILEGELDVILDLIKKMHEVPFQNGAKRVSTSIKIDDRRDKASTMDDKINAVESKL